MESQTDGPPPGSGDGIQRRYRLPTPEQMADNDIEGMSTFAYWSHNDSESHGYLPTQASYPRSIGKRGAGHISGSIDETGSWGGDPGVVLGRTRHRVAGEWKG
jgi:hypothetical protein